MNEQASQILDLDREALAIEAARRRLRWLRWCWLAGSLALYAGWDAFDTMVLNRFDPILGGFVIDWSVIAALGFGLTLVVSQWEDRQLARMAELFVRNAAAERAAIQLEAAQVTARGIAHNLNQPLAAIRGYAELLHDAAADQGTASDTRRIIAETDRAAAMVRQLLQLTHYETTAYPGGARIIDLERAAGR
ncbi:MAG TPA: histidine kinase dimerization/phospho-acceptor domain-containing protein [Roseiflexaceae bacterium]|nr:histidine kinase dimerization/phospho-acceptor domain-containing protein [Roseiflexaceae bacterium]